MITRLAPSRQGEDDGLPPHLSRQIDGDGRRAFEIILHKLDQAIASGAFAAGDRLPPERELAIQFNVSRSSVREAVRVLEALGLVSVRRGVEHGVTLLKEPGNALTRLLSFHLSLRHLNIPTLVDFRIAIESWAAGRVAQAPTPQLIAELATLVESMEESIGPVDFQEADSTFHIALVRGANNELATLVHEAARTVIAHHMLTAIHMHGDWTRLRPQLSRDHRSILTAIGRRDSELAAELAARHISDFYAGHLAG